MEPVRIGGLNIESSGPDDLCFKLELRKTWRQLAGKSDISSEAKIP